MNSSHDECRAVMDELADEQLSAEPRAAVEGHLRTCEECQSEFAAVIALRSAARALPREIEPSRDLWEGIASRISAEQREPRIVALASRRGLGRPIVHRGPLAAAALLLIALSAGLTLSLVGGRAPAPIAGDPAADVTPDRGAALVAFRPVELEYQKTVRALEEEFHARRGSLAPATVEVVEESLRVIDLAIAEARTALEADPSSADLPLHLSGIYRRKVELLSGARGL